jgi:thiamine-monophosphate kinase
MALGEFDLIRRFFTRSVRDAVLGIGDDCALLSPTPGQLLAVSTDTLVEGRHFFPDVDPTALGWKALAVNLSDLAAMGAAPRWFTLCLTLPSVDEAWLAAFTEGLFQMADEAEIALVGGDTTRGPLSLSIQVMGEVPPGAALRRDAAQAGDDVWLGGPTGAAALAVAHRAGRLRLGPEDLQICAAALDWPRPQRALGMALRGLAHAAIDVSDGLLADLGHILNASGLAAVLDPSAMPVPSLSPALLAADAYQSARWFGGDDYVLCFTAPVMHRAEIEAISRALDLPLARIGHLEAGQGIYMASSEGPRILASVQGFDHFA